MINALIASLPSLVDVMVLFAFFCYMFGIVGMQLYKGSLRQQCYTPEYTSNAKVYQQSDFGARSSDTLPAGVSKVTLADEEYCTVETDGVVEGRYICAKGTVCLQGDTSMNFDNSGFDDIGMSFITVFQCISLEG